MEDAETTTEEQIFHNTVRENIIFFLLLLCLIIVSWLVVRTFRKQGEREPQQPNGIDDDDEATVYRISLWLCTFSLAVAVGAVLLLPISIVSNEVLLHYPNSYYMQWLNSSLIQGLWNHVFLFSNLSLFIFLPFAYLLTESEGFAGHKKGLRSRMLETLTVLLLLAAVVYGMAFTISSLLDSDRNSLFNVWNYYLPFIYSCISFLGVLLLLLCTPAGLVRLFSMAGQFLVKPQFLRDFNQEYQVAKLEEECLRRQLASPNGFRLPSASLSDYAILPPSPEDPIAGLKNGALKASLKQRLKAAQAKTALLERQRRGSGWRNLLYVILMVGLLVLTIFTVLTVVQNAIQLITGFKELPLSRKKVTLGEASLFKLGFFGAVLEIILILSLVVTSAVGLFTLPGLSQVQPKFHATPLAHIILHCALLLLLSSALPLLSRILGITNLDLLGEFGQIEWLGSLSIILLYNLLFVFSVSACLATKFTATIRQELITRLKGFALSLVSKDPGACASWPNSPLQATTSMPNKKD